MSDAAAWGAAAGVLGCAVGVGLLARSQWYIVRTLNSVTERMTLLRDRIDSPAPGLRDDAVQLDLASAVLRMEQTHQAEDDGLRDLLAERLATCDAVRLRRYLTPRTLAQMEATVKGTDGPAD